MSTPGYPSPGGERLRVNMPAVIGVVFVALLAVVVWVVASSSDDSAPAASSAPTTTTIAPGVTTTTAPTSTAATTPAPLPETTTTLPPTTVAETTTTAPPPPTTVAPATTAPGAVDGAVLGDLAIPGRPMLAPTCNDSFITVVASAVGANATADGIARVLDTYPGSNYLRTDQTCPSLAQSIDGQPIYVVYFGPFPFASDACAARAEGPPDAYPRRLSTTVGPDHGVPCT